MKVDRPYYEKLDERGKMRVDRFKALAAAADAEERLEIVRRLVMPVVMLLVLFFKLWSIAITGKALFLAFLWSFLSGWLFNIAWILVVKLWTKRRMREIDRAFPEPPPL